jgi:uncharacterized membrane protein
MPSSVLGLVTGLVAGFALATHGFLAFLLVLLFGAIGLVVGKIIDRELDVSRFIDLSRFTSGRTNVRSWRRR